MATEFPNNFDVFPTLVDNVDDILAVHQNNRADAIEALESKVGVTSSPTTTSHDYLLRNLPAQDGSVIISNLNAALLGGAAKDADGTLAGNSDSSIPTEKAVKTYVDAHKDDIADAHDASAISVVDEFVHSSSTNVQDVLDDVDVALTSHQNDDVDSTNIVHGIRQGAGNGFDADKLDGAHKDIDETLSGNSDLSIPSEKAVKTYVDTNINALGTASLVDTGTGAGEVPLNSDLGTASLVDTGTGAGEVPLNSDLPDFNQDLRSDDNVAFATVNIGGTLNAANVDTGNGATEIFDMNQNVKSDSNVTFNNLTINGGMLPESSPYLGSESIIAMGYHTPSRGLYNSSWRDNRGASFIYGSGGDGPYCGNSSTRVYNNNDYHPSHTWRYARF